MKFKMYWSFIIFLGSYLPLCLILIIQDVDNKYIEMEFWSAGNEFFFPKLAHPWFLWISLFVCLSAFIKLYCFMRIPTSQVSIKITAVKSIPNDIINYVFPYVVSFMGLDLNDPRKIFGFLLFLFWMFLITHKSGQILMNPLLLVFGWNLYEAEIITSNQTKTCRILSRVNLKANSNYYCEKVQDFYLING